MQASLKPSRRRIILYPFLLLGIVLVVALLDGLPANTGKVDFRAYWSASHLLAHGRNSSDSEALLEVMTTKTGWDGDYAMKTWNPPWVLVWLLPYGRLDFERAANLWLGTNLLFLFAAAVVSWRFYAGEARRVWLPILVAVLFPSSLVALIYGQMNLLVLFGLVMFFHFRAAGKAWAAGLMLAFTLAKPHLVYLALVIVFFCRW